MRLAFALFFSFCLFNGQSQSNLDVVNYSGLNKKFLAHLVKLKVDSYRLEKKLPKLNSDSLLILPACDQSDYMSAQNKLTHFQERGAKHDPQRRFEFYEINHVIAGENVQYIPINTLLKVDYQKDLINVRTYDDLATVIAKGWRYSKPHYANILTPEFSLTAVCIELNQETETLWATQVFGQLNGPHPETTTNASFPYETILVDSKKKSKKRVKELKEQKKFSYGVKAPKSFEDCPRELNNKLDLSNFKLQVTRNKVLLCVYDLNKIKRLFPNNKDGLAVELIGFSNAFGCNEYQEKPNRRNGLSMLDGQLLKPVYRNNILKQIAQLEEENRQRKKVRGEKRCNFIELGDTPPELSGVPIDARLFYVKDKNLCTQIQFFGYCGKPLDFKPNKLPLQFNLPKSNFKPLADTFNMVVDVRFKKSSATIENDQIDTLIEQMKSNELEIKRITIDAFASIEGTKENNEKLFDNRTKELVNRLSKFQNRKIEWEVSATENWDLFYDQIIGTKWFYLNSLSRSKIRAAINDSANQVELEPLFAEQRIAHISFVVIPEMNKRWTFKLAKTEWLELISQLDPIQVDNDIVQRLELLQLFFYFSYPNQPEPAKKWIKQLYVAGNSSKTSLLRYRQLMFHAVQEGINNPIVSVEQLKQMNRSLGLNEIDYNIKSIIAQNAHLFDEKTKIPLIKSLLIQAETDGASAQVFQDLELWYHIEMAKLVFGSQEKKNMDKAANSLQYVREFYITQESTAKDSVDLAEFMILFDELDWATELLKPIAFDTNENAYRLPALKLYLRNCMQHDLEGRETEMQLVVYNAYEQLGQSIWCRLFFTPCPVPYRVFDYAPLRTLYCEACKSLIKEVAD